MEQNPSTEQSQQLAFVQVSMGSFDVLPNGWFIASFFIYIYI